MNEQKLAGLMGLAVRSRQTASGMDACRIMIRSARCGILLLDSEAGQNTRKKTEDMCKGNEIPMIFLPPGLIEKATGKSNMVIGIQKGSIAEQILKLNEGLPDS